MTMVELVLLRAMKRELEEKLVQYHHLPHCVGYSRCNQCNVEARSFDGIEHTDCPIAHINSLITWYEAGIADKIRTLGE